ncbi:hypothetical protein [Georgenia sp. SUBG003]|uniref:hypothetical protein n=1 Tax=Georgenia sp. SUBG003 TaxID=1497974 RepID=UPI0004D687DC|nr:hypothetical protein DA06_05015 [Georgenia sp. SUBG003]
MASEVTPPSGQSDGAFQSLDQMANWVRFAETKATILTAGLGVVLTMLMAKVDLVVTVLAQGCRSALIVGGLALVVLVTFLWTLFWLMRAIGPQKSVNYSRLNRFAWPSLLQASTAQVVEHVGRVKVSDDAWQQVVDLARLADRKFTACGRAAWGFAVLIVAGLGCVLTALAVSA